ncbi:MAG TPA: glycosyltransferase family 39 protein [Vicinamibacterales bacterium]
MTVLDLARDRAARSRSALAIALLVVTAAALLVRVVSIAEPLGIDQSLWASAVKGMSRGQVLYTDVWEQRPPGIYLTYLLGFSVLGWSAASIALLDILAAAATALLLWIIVRATSGSTVQAGLTSALYGLFTIPSWLYGHGGFLERSVCETFIVVCIAFGWWCATRFGSRPHWLLPFCIGIAGGAAIILKPNAGLYLPAILLWTLFYRRPAGWTNAGTGIRLLAGAVPGALLLPALAGLWLWQLGALAEARIAVVDFNRFYVGQGFDPATYAVDFAKAVFLRMKTDPLWLAGAVGSALAAADLLRTRRLSPTSGLAVLWGAAAALVIVVNGARLFNSYFIQAVPPLAILAAWTLIESARVSRPRAVLAVLTGVLMLGVVVQRQYVPRVVEWTRADLEVLLGRVDRMTYLERFGGYANRRGYSARANTELADYLRANTDRSERIYLFGINGAGVYFESDRLTAHRFLRVNFYVPHEFPDPRFTLEAVVADLEADPPRYLVFERLNAVSPRGAEMAAIVDELPDNPALRPLLDQYRHEVTIEDFTLYRRVD